MQIAIRIRDRHARKFSCPLASFAQNNSRDVARKMRPVSLSHQFHRKQQQLYCFCKEDATHDAWTTSHLPIIHALSYYWSVSLAMNVVFADDW